jgi:hypothetical protein
VSYDGARCSAEYSFPTLPLYGGGNFGITDYKPDAIITSAYLAAARKAGAHALLTKPFQTAEVLHAITLATRDTGPR